MLIATFGPTTGWVGKIITFEDGVFTLDGFGPVAATEVLAYDGQGQIEWAYSDLKGWVQQQASQTRVALPRAQPLPHRPAIPPPRKATSATAARLLRPKSKTGRVPMWMRVVIAVVIVWLCLAGLFHLLGMDQESRDASAVVGYVEDHAPVATNVLLFLDQASDAIARGDLTAAADAAQRASGPLDALLISSKTMPSASGDAGTLRSTYLDYLDELVIYGRIVSDNVSGEQFAGEASPALAHDVAVMFRDDVTSQLKALQ